MECSVPVPGSALLKAKPLVGPGHSSVLSNEHVLSPINELNSTKTLKTVKKYTLGNKVFFFDPNQMHKTSKATNTSRCHTADASLLAVFSRECTSFYPLRSPWQPLSITTSSCFLSCGITIRLITFRVICRKQ